ncbi:hypothetical protein IAG44_24070 [Streptomyces roseirectus]|uniref:Uncharacterized protein n=1 Tax=Streptomyces roseirectus TaxID=2768066 RepID=A0A7H0IHC0_9ACTN|nr:hypothetical protein [Streptomyces roseirectus]QNP72186.1 hypothetical protein IAG44_24070 [Streptomyces roseirectus]
MVRGWETRRVLAAAGEAAHASAVAMESVVDASDAGRPPSWKELHTTAAVLLRRRAEEGRRLGAGLREYD